MAHSSPGASSSRPSAPDTVIEVRNLVVEYGKGAKKTRAVDDLSFRVQQGECVGFIGANGAGKSSTIKTLMGFVYPPSGEARLFGIRAGEVESRRRVGYLPEVALYYPFMKARELLNLYGGLHGMDSAALRKGVPVTLEKVGLGGKGETLLKNFSKGMQQRLGIAQAILPDPDALILDELSSGLDPLGRHDLRQTMLELKARGKTIFFSSHELTEVEALCDRVIMINQGRLALESPVASLLKPLHVFEIQFAMPGGGECPPAVKALNAVAENGRMRTEIHDAGEYARAIQTLSAAGATIVSTGSRTQSLEDYFISLVRGEAPGT